MEDHDSSSTGLIIGMIAGGAIVLILAVVFVGGFLFMGRSAAPPAVGPPPMAAEVAMEAEKGAKGGPIEVEGAPFPNPKRVEEQEQKVLGTWTATFNDGRTQTWNVRADKTMDVTVVRKGKADEQIKGAWELLVEIGGPGTTIRFVSDKGKRDQWSIRYLDDDRFVIVPTVVAAVDGVPAKGPDDDVPYHRKRAEKKP